MITIGSNKLRTALTTISVAWGIFVLVFLLGLGRGLNDGARHKFARDATNGVWISGNKTSVAHDGYDVDRKIRSTTATTTRPPRSASIDHIAAQFFIKGGTLGRRRDADQARRQGERVPDQCRSTPRRSS